MDFFTALLLIYQLKSEQRETLIWFKDYKSCYEAQHLADDLYQLAQGTQMFCLESNIVSASVRPKRRPE